MDKQFNPLQSSAPADEDASQTALRNRLIAKIKEHIDKKTPVAKLIPDLNLYYITSSETRPCCRYSLSIGLILSGKKHLIIGNRSYFYGTGSMILTSVEVPTSSELLDVTRSSPFICVSLKLQPELLTKMLTKQSGKMQNNPRCFEVDRPVFELLEDFERLLRLLDHKEQIEERAPLLIRDIHYLAINSSAGRNLQGLYTANTGGQRIRRTISYVAKNFREDLSVEKMADMAGMAVTTFHRHFKEITNLSPLQYQKRIRLYEAQQFLLRGDGDVNSAAFFVGYQSPQQFSRDYKKIFGMPPGHSAKEVRKSLAQILANQEGKLTGS